MDPPGRDFDDPLDRLAAEEDWSRRADAVEAQVTRERRWARLRRLGRTRMRRTPRQRRSDAFGRPVARGGVSMIFVLLVALFAATGTALWLEAIPDVAGVFVFVLCGWLISLCLHEFAHALTAHRGGDDTVVGKGYLRLDPLKYGHPLLTFALPLFFLITGGLPLPGGAVLIETHRLRNRFRDMLVSAAGPATNVVAAVVLLTVVSAAGPEAIWTLDQPRAAFWAALTLLAYLQVASAVLNLLPIPGLDGYGIIEPYLSDAARHTGAKIRPFGILLVFLLLYLPPVRDAFTALVEFFPDTAGAPINGVYWGYELFLFWRDWL